MLDLVKEIANAWLTLWMVGLLISFRMIVPARGFLSDRSAKWLSHHLTQTRGISTRRRFDLSFKRYVDRTFHARQKRWGRCRIWTLRYRSTAFVSFLTFLIIYIAVLFSVDFDQLDRGVMALRAAMQDPTAPGYDASVAGFVALIEDLDTDFIVATMLIFYGITFGLFNTITDYVSFFETRNVLARLGRGPLRDVMWVCLDLVLTTAISIAGFVLLWVLTTYFGTLLSGRAPAFFSVVQEGGAIGIAALVSAVSMVGVNQPALNPTDPAMIAMTLSTYATSVWIWVFFVGSFAIRAVAMAAPALRLVRFLIDVEDHPFRAAWLMFALLWTAGVGVMALIA